MSSSQIMLLDMKIEEVALPLFIALIVITLLIKQRGNSSLASRHFDMLIVCKDKCVIFWSVRLTVQYGNKSDWYMKWILRLLEKLEIGYLNWTHAANRMIQIILFKTFKNKQWNNYWNRNELKDKACFDCTLFPIE